MVFAQEERRLIGERTKRALAELKKQGKKLGWHNPKIRKAFKKAIKERKLASKEPKEKALAKKSSHHRAEKAQAFAENLRPIVATMVDNNYSLRAMCEQLNKPTSKAPTFTGKGRWHLRSVARLVDRLGLKTKKA